MKTILTFALIQNGQCVFGAGGTELGAARDARKWIEPPNGAQGSATIPEVYDMLGDPRVDGDLCIIERADDPEKFDSYMRNQHCYVQSPRGNWRNQ